ncbi:MAG TPA: peptidoglycan editing factor PgeF [Alphaproteobacteria bacterium]|nr:peptidoglycan editing factor PgeF [Alphaproteobacteria bacterium]HNS45025.1 peptidoglycan editing factor PgeF [Alphaproteobacteria bacterium]
MIKPPALTFPDLFGPRITHGFFGRKGGVSHGIFESLNVTLYSGDDVDRVKENRDRVRVALGGQTLLTLKQTHSPCCLLPSEAGPAEDFCEGDALVTDQPDIVLGVMTADCAPILLEGQKPDGTPVIGATHAGWGGALKGVCESTVKRMIELGAVPDTIRAAIGPCIGVESYEVSPDFLKSFLIENEESRTFFTDRNGKSHFDLVSYVTHRLERAGVRHITASHVDTYKEEQDYFSFRRATHRGEGQYGRQISAITIKR